MKKSVLIILVAFLTIAITSCATGKKDCQGHRHHVKTDMGGYL
jgi:hypothetical protein